MILVYIMIKIDDSCLEYTRLRAMVARCVRLAWSKARDQIRWWLHSTTTFDAGITRPSGTVIRCGNVDAIVPGDQIVQPRREDGKVCAQDRQTHSYAFMWSVVWQPCGGDCGLTECDEQ